MKSHLLLALIGLALLLNACGGPQPANSQTEAVSSVTEDGADDSSPARAAEAQDIDLRLFDADPTTGAPRSPTCWVHADSFSRPEGDIWSFEGAKAVIYGRSDGQEEQIHIEAGSGRFQETRMAYLKDNVVARVGDMRIELSDIEWINDERLARSDNAISLETPDAQLSASSLLLYPDNKQLILTDVTGTFRFEKE